MPFFPVFLSVVVVMRNQSKTQEQILSELCGAISPLVSDYEIIIVDNASTDESVSGLKDLTAENGLPNLQVYALTKEVDSDTVFWVGIENALGDFIAVIDPLADDIQFLPRMLDQALSGADVVFANNEQKATQGLVYDTAFRIFNGLYKWFNGIHLSTEAPQYRVLSRRVVNFILQHPQPALTYRHLPASGGFAKASLNYSAKPKGSHAKHLGDSIDRGMRLLVSTTPAPMR
ncbi:MAG: glycosyltransferase, partial [Methylococcales bacterium]